MPPNVTIRPYAAGDEQAVIDLWNDTMWADPIDAAAWRSRYLLDPNFSPGECPLAIDPATGVIDGFVLGFTDKRADRPTEAWVVGFGVRKARRRKGIGTALMTSLEGRWLSGGVNTIHYGPYLPSYVAPGVDVTAYADAVQFLSALGAHELSRPVSMKASLTGYSAHPEVNQLRAGHAERGIAIRPAEATDIVPLIAFLKAKFPHWDNDAIPVLRDLFAGDPRFVTMQVAEDNGAIIGYAQSRNERFGPFGVDERYRGQGVGSVLLSDTLLAMRGRGFHSAWFLWTSDRTAKLYQQHGFEQVRRFVMMDKTIAPTVS